MTERNLTAYGINGTKLVRRVLIRQKILHLNRETNGKALTGNMLGHDIFTNIPDRTEGSSDEIEPLHGKGPKLQEGGFQENPIPEELQKKTLTTPSPSHPQLMTHTQPSLVPSNTRDQPTNNLQTPPGDRYRPKPSHQLPPSSNYRYLGSSTSLINSRHQTPPVSSTGSSQIQEGNNVSSLQSSHPPKVDKDSSKQKTTDLKEPVEGHSKGSSGSSLPEETTDTKNTNEATLSKHGETINKTLPLYNRMPFRAPFPRRPNIGPVQNRTSGYQSVRSPKRRPFPPRINNTAINKVQPGITSRNQRVLNHNRPPIFPGQGRNGTIIRLPPKIKTNPQNVNVSTSSETNLKFPADTGADLKSVLAFSTGKSPSKNNDTILSVRGSSEITIDHILPNSTTNHQRIPGVFNNRQHASNRQILLKRRNNTGIRLPSGFAVRGLTHLENSNYKTGHKDTSKDRNTEPSANMPFPTEAPITNTDAFKGLIQRSENAIDLINKEHLPRNHELSKIITGEHEHPMLSNINTTLPLLINQNPDSESRGQRENAQNQNRNKLIVRRKDGTLVRLRPKRPNQIKPNIPIFHSESVILPTTKPESPYKTQAGAADLNISNQNILPRITDRDQNLSGTPSRDPDLSRITERDPDLSGTPSKDPDLSIITDRDPDWSGATSRDQNLSGTPSQDPDLSRITDRDPDLSGIPSREKDLMRITDRGNSLRWITDKDQDLPSTTMEPVPPKIMKENAPHPKLGPKYTQRRNGTFHPELRVDTEESGLKDKDAGVEKGSKETRVFFYQTAGAEDNTDNISQRVINRNNSTAVEPESNSPKGPNFTATFTTSRKHGALLRPALNTQTRPNITPQRKISTNTRLPPKPRPDTSSKNFTHHLKLGWSTEVPLSPEPTENTLPVYQVSEDGINQINVQNVTSYGFVIIWAAPEGRFKNFVIAVTEENDGEDDGSKQDVETKRDGRNITTNVMDVRGNSSSSSSSIGIRQNSIVSLPGSARSYPVSDLSAHTGYSVTLYTTSPGSKTHTFIVTTGPEPPSHLSFSDITDSSLSVSWRRPKSSVSGFKVTYIHTKEGEPISVSVDSGISTLSLSKLSPGSTYEVAVISVLGLDESDPIKDFVITLPDPPTDLRAINITDTKALLLWRPALATADQYIITYHTDEASGANTSVKVSGNAVEQQLQALKASTKYRVTIFSRLGDQKSSSTHTSFTTASGSPGKGEPPRDLKAKPVTARTALLSWKPPSSPVTSYKLTYFIKGGERKEVTLNPGVSEHKLRGLRPSSLYTALLQGERGGVYTSSISTEFTTVTLRFPFPSDCSQELLNGEKDSGLVEIFPGGKEGRPVMVYCDMETDEGGWTVFQRRKDGKTKFFRSWQEYRKGFGDLEGEFWLGNDALHNLTLMTPMTMRVDLRTQNESVYARYASFSMDTLRKHYMLQVSGYSGTAGDSMRYHDKRPFSTHDRDPQPLITRCAMSYKGGWWYKNCHEANLNGQYGTHTNHQGVIWTAWKGTNFSIPFTEMKIRPASFKP